MGVLPATTLLAANEGLTKGLVQEQATQGLVGREVGLWHGLTPALLPCSAQGGSSTAAGGWGWQGPLSSPERDGENRPNLPLESPSQDDFCWSHALKVSPGPGFAGWTGDAPAHPAHCPPCALLCMGTAKHSCRQRGSGLTLQLFLHHYHRFVCVNTMAPLASLLQTHLHRYHSPISISPADLSVPSCLWAGGGMLGTPCPPPHSSVPWGTAWAGEWVVGSCCSRWSVGLDHGTTNNKGCVHPPGGHLQELVVNWCLQDPAHTCSSWAWQPTCEPGWFWLEKG